MRHLRRETQYLVKEEHFFYSSQQLLVISERSGVTRREFLNVDESHGLLNQISWDELLSVETQPDPYELIIFYNEGAAGSGEVQQTQLSARNRIPTEEHEGILVSKQLKLTCWKRDQLVCHLRYMMDVMRIQTKPTVRLEECFYAPIKGLSATNSQKALVTLYETAIEIEHFVAQHLTVQHLTINELHNANEMHENLKFNQSSEMIEDDATEMIHSFQHSENTDQQLKVMNTSEIIGAKQLLINELLPSPTSRQSIAINLKDAQAKVSTVLLCHIERLIQVEHSLVVVTTSQDVEWISLKGRTVVEELIQDIQKQYKALFPRLILPITSMQLPAGVSLTRSKLETILAVNLSQELTFMRWPAQTTKMTVKNKGKEYSIEREVVFKMTVDMYNAKFNLMLKDQAIVLDQRSIYLLDTFEWSDQEKPQPMNQANLTALECITLLNKSPNHNLALTFSNEVQFLVKTRTYEDRERLVSVVLTLRSFLYDTDPSKPDLLRIRTDGMAESNELKVWGYEPVFTKNGHHAKLTIDYETAIQAILSKITVWNQKTQRLFDQVMANCHFYSLQELRIRSEPNEVLQALGQVIGDYARLEESEAKQVENNLVSGEGCRACRSDLINHNNAEDDAEFKNQALNDSNEKVRFGGLSAEESKGEEVMEFLEPVDEDATANIMEATAQTVTALNVLCALLNSNVFFAAITAQSSIIVCLTKLMNSKNSTIAILAAKVLRASLHFNGRNASNLYHQEKTNKKRFLYAELNEDIDDEFCDGSDSDQPDVMAAILENLEYFEGRYDSTQKVFPLHMTGIYLILSSVLQQRVMSTPDEVLTKFYTNINDSETYKGLSLLDKMSLCHASLIKSGNVLAHDNRVSMGTYFSLRASQITINQVNKASGIEEINPSRLEEHFVVQYLFSMLLSQNLKHLATQDAKVIRNVTDYLLSNTIQFIWHLQLQELTNLTKQKEVSIDILAQMLCLHHRYKDILNRILPIALKKNVPKVTTLDQKSHFTKYRNFFQEHYAKPLNNARELWNDEMRRELVCELAREIRAFWMGKQVVMESEARRSRNPSMNLSSTPKSFSGASGDNDASRASRVSLVPSKPIKWNYAEFEVRYEKSLNEQYFVGGYYLKKLLETDGAETPSFKSNEHIDKPDEFWDQLQVSFMTSTDKHEQHQILMTVCQLYKKKWIKIGKIKSMGYWMRLIQNGDYAHCHFLLLQLFHIALCEMKHDELDKLNTHKKQELDQIRLNVVKANMQKFIKEKGFLLLHNCINLVFKELPEVDLSHADESQPVKELIYLENGGAQQPKEEEKVNFTVNKTHKMYFQRNSKNVNMAILSLKIFDLIFTNMQFIDNLPMSSNRQYMLQSHSLATLTQTILLENGDLTREVLIFIEKHLSDHYTFYLMRQTGMIEFLILCLSTKNNFRALRLLKIFQQVCLQFNQQLKLGGELAANDLKMILEDKQKRDKELNKDQEEVNKVEPVTKKERNIIKKGAAAIPGKPAADKQQEKDPLLGDSIFLRYLPVPFIKYLNEKGEQSFLEIYRRHDYRHPILIWNASMRKTLENKIKANAQDFLIRLRDFAKKLDEDRDPTQIDQYSSRLTEIVKYEQIENEVRCGRYYLGVWTSQRFDSEKDFTIKPEEEEEFQQKMQAELRQCIYEENMKNIGKIIILFKMCWLTLRKFKSTRINSLNEIKRILMAICKPQSFENTDNYFSSASPSPAGLDNLNPQPSVGEKTKEKFTYNSETSELLYYGTKIFYEAIKDNLDNKTEILTMNGVEIMSDIVNFILSKAKKSTQTEQAGGAPRQRNKSMADIDEINEDDSGVFSSAHKSDLLGANMPQQFSEIDVTAIEAETLLLSMKAIGRLLKEDTQSFIDIRLDQRIMIFTQMTQILNLSVQLCDFIEDRELDQHHQAANRKQLTSNSQTFIIQTQRTKIDERDQSSIHNTSHCNRGPGVKRRKKPQRQQIEAEQKDDAANQRTRDGDLAKNEMDDKKRDFDSKYRILLFLRNCKETDSNELDVIRQTSKSKRNEKANQETYVISLILKIAKSIFKMMNHIAQQPQLHPELIASGLVWQALRHAYFDLKVYFDIKTGLPFTKGNKKRRSGAKDHDKVLKKILDDSTQSVMLIVSFAQRYKESGTETMQFKNLTKQQEREIMKKFHQSIQRIFTKRMQEELLCKFTVDNGNKMDVAGKISGQSFLKLFSIQEFNSPELIWNSKTRTELHGVLRFQINELIAEENALRAAETTELRPTFQLPRSRLQSDVSDVSGATKISVVSFDKFCNVLLRFDYEVNREKLRVDEIFVQNFTSHKFNEAPKDFNAFTQEKKESFAKGIIDRLKEMRTRSQDEDILMASDRLKDTEELVRAFKRLMVEFNLNIRQEQDFEDYFNTLCSLIKLELEKGKTNSEEQQAIAESVLEIVKNIVKRRLDAQAGDHIEDNEHCEFLLGCNNSKRLGNNDISPQPNRAMLNLLWDVLEQQGDSIECIKLKQHVIGILGDVIKIKDYVLPLFSTQGILVFLLKILFDQEKYPIDACLNRSFVHSPLIRSSTTLVLEERKSSFFGNSSVTDQNQSVMQVEDLEVRTQYEHSRQTLLDIIMKVEIEQKRPREEELFQEGKGMNVEYSGVLKAFLPQNFLREIEHKMENDADNLEFIAAMQKEWLRNFDRTTYESVFVLWNDELRGKCQAQIEEQCAKFRNSEPVDLCKLPFIQDPKLSEEYRVGDIILRVYNKNANVYINTSLENFIPKLIEELEKVHQNLHQLRSSENVANFTKPYNKEEEGGQQSRKTFHYECHKAQLLLSALLLSIEQLLNDENPNVQTFRANVQSSINMSFREIPPAILRYMKVWVQSPVFLDLHIPPQIRITFLQVLYLVVSAKEALSKLRGETLVSFIADMISQVYQRNGGATGTSGAGAAAATQAQETTGYIKLEDCLILMIISKVIFLELSEDRRLAERSVWIHLTKETSLQHLVSIAQHGSHCDIDVKYIYSTILLGPQHYKYNLQTIRYSMEKCSYPLKLDLTIRTDRDDLIKNDKKWRTSDSRKYSQLSGQDMESFVDNDRGLYDREQYLPIISKGSIASYPAELRPEEHPQPAESVSNQSQSRSVNEEVNASLSNQ